MRRLVITIVASVALVTGITTWTILHVHAQTCASQNKALTVLGNVLETSVDGPHTVTTPTAVSNRAEIYRRQIAEIRKASCR